MLFARDLQVGKGTGTSCSLAWNCNLFRQRLTDSGEGSPEAPEALTLCMQIFLEEIQKPNKTVICQSCEMLRLQGVTETVRGA